MIFLQRTVGEAISFTGVGLHTGHETRLTLQPAPVNTGLVFVVGEGEEQVEIPVVVENVQSDGGAVRNTTLRKGDVAVHTVEHVLSALNGCGVTNCRLHLEGDEVPEAPKGGAVVWVDLLEEAGIVDQGLPANYYRIPATIRFRQDDVEIVAEPADDFRLTVHIDYDDPRIGVQEATFSIDKNTFRTEIAPSRTFATMDDVNALREQGHALGGTLENAVVVDKGQLVGDQVLRFPDEFVRHKMLDLLGDLSLLGMPILGHITARKSGHAANTAFVRMLAKRERRSPRLYPPRRPENWDISSIMKVMPHRYPFLLVDRIVDLEPGKRVVGIKNVTINEPFFQGHFPEHPIMPAVLIIEAMAQVGGVLLLNSVENPDSKLVYFGGIDHARFRQPVTPGDQLRFELELLKIRGPICKMAGIAYVDGKKVAEAEMLSSVVER